jgi:hypothetical protein
LTDNSHLNNTSRRSKHESLPSNHGLEQWLERYKPGSAGEMPAATFGIWQIKRTIAGDTWSTGNVVIFSAEEPNNGKIDQSRQQAFLERAKILRQSQHAHIQPVIDFFADEFKLRWVVPEQAGVAIDKRLTDETLASDLALKLVAQFTSIITYFSMQAPHTIPRLDASSLIVQPDMNLCATDFQAEYFFGQPKEEGLAMIGEFADRVAKRTQPDDAQEKVAQLARELCSNPPPQHVSTLSKVRNTLRHIEETVAAPHSKADA